MIDDPTNPLDYTCDTCGAQPGEDCTNKTGEKASHTHEPRLHAAATRDRERNPSKDPTL